MPENHFNSCMDKAQLKRIEIQKNCGSSGNVISTSDLKREERQKELNFGKFRIKPQTPEQRRREEINKKIRSNHQGFGMGVRG